MPAASAQMMRLAASMAVEDGLMICAPVHDAFLLEAPIGEIEEHSARLAAIIARASEIVLGNGRRCRVDRKIVRYPDRYLDDRGREMFETVMRLLAEVEREEQQRAVWVPEVGHTGYPILDATVPDWGEPQDTFFSSCYSDSSRKGICR